MSARGKPPATLSARIFQAFLLTISVFAVFSFLSYNLERRLMLRSDRMLRTAMSWAELAEDTERLEAALAKSLVTGDREALLAYERLAASFRKRAAELRDDPAGGADDLAVEDALGMTATLLEEAATAAAARRRRDFDQGNEAFRAFAATGEALRNRIYQAVIEELRRESASYQRISRRLDFVGRASFVLVLGGLGLAVLLTLFLARSLTRPLAELAEAAQRVSRGDFSLEIPVRDGDEVGHLTEAFNRMSRSLARMIQDLREKSALEARLHQRELENLAMQNMLQETRLALLQSQINPHFFFNTLNVGVHLASLEKAERTAVFFENVGRLFRYSLGKLETAATLKEELEHVENYTALLQMRFGGRAFALRREIEPELASLILPRLTLQPLVENAYLHGLAGRGDGRIELLSYRTETGIALEVRDNGKGMAPEKAAEILQTAGRGESGAGVHGLSSVIARLRIWTGREDAVTIESRPGEGTAVRLLLPPRFVPGERAGRGEGSSL